MSNDLAVSMDELERQSAELLPSRETLCVCNSGSSYNSLSQVAGNSQAGLLNLSILSGDNINILNLL
ncbi:MAG TPA: hypothetical protein VGG83_29045 [Trebonia sp.]|jgi:hypothetical protein